MKENCTQCRHFYCTWNPKVPNGCRAYGIQSKMLPSSIVSMAGMGDCQGFTPKTRPASNKGQLDLNSKDPS